MGAVKTAAKSGVLVDQYGNRLTASKDRDQSLAELRGAILKLKAAYDAAAHTKENARHWRFADDLSAAAANSAAVRHVLRNRSRYECLESNSFGKGIVKTLATDFVSTGPRLHIDGQEQIIAQRIQSEFIRWSRAVRLNRKLRSARLAKCVDGETFILAVNNPRLRCPVQLDIRLVEADQITTPGWIDGVGEHAVDGIRFCPDTGEPIEYDLLRQHPGDRRIGGPNLAATPVDARDMIHLFEHDRPGQVRGIPELTPSLPLFAFLRRYTLATVANAEFAASLNAVLETQVGMFDPDEADKELLDAFDSIDFERGMMAALPFGYKLNQLKPEQPISGYVEFRDAILCEIARPVGMPRNKVLGDSSPYNFSSTRADQDNYYGHIDVERQDWDIECLDRVFEWWLDEALLIPGYLELNPTTYLSRHYTWPQRQSVNPLQDATTAIKLIEAGLMLESDYLAQRQIDPETFFAARQRQDERRQRRLNINEVPKGTNFEAATI